MIAHIQLHDFFVAVERSARADLDGRPLLIGGPLAGPGIVAVASQEARDRGIHTGMRMARAVALAPDAICVPGAIERYLEVSAQIDERLRRCTPWIEWAAVDEAWLRLEGPRAPRRLSLDDVRAELLRDFNLATSVGIGSTRAVAAIASRLMHPSGMLLVLPGYEARLLSPVDIKRLPGITDEQIAQLRAAGVHSLGELAALDEALLHQLIGRGGSVLARHALGLDDRPLAPADVPKGIARTAMFGACGPSQARGAVVRLAEQAAAALRRSGHAARQIRLRVRDQAGERMRVHRADPAISGDHDVVAIADALAHRLLHPCRDLHEAAIFLTALTPAEPQLQLFRDVC